MLNGEDRLNYDVYYAKNKSIFFDLKILLVIIKKLLEMELTIQKILLQCLI